MEIKSFFEKAIEENASDLHLIGGSPPVIRINGNLKKIKNEPLDPDDLERSVNKLMFKKNEDPKRSRVDELSKEFQKNKELDISFNVGERYFRVNLHRQQGKIGLAARLIPEKIPSPKEINFDETIYNLTHLNDGLVLVVGASGSGKSTTLASMLDIINKERRAHIITIEDPIEYRIHEKQSIIEQRELGFDTRSFSSALKYSLRQDPNVIMVGEMRDVETFSAALTAAETGHLVFSTLHTSTAVETITRIVDMFPADKESQVISQLSTTLRGVVSQQLLPKINGGRVAAREIMISNSAITNLIRSKKFKQIYTNIQTGRKEGMITMNKSIDILLEKGYISEEVAERKKRNMDTSATYY
ncbi:MAG: type IV pilus twitching motility protein PilT [Patescibacteria group bacterium]